MRRLIAVIIIIVFALFSCRLKLPVAESMGGVPTLFPDYVNVTVPVNIAPLNFRIHDSVPGIVLFGYENEELRVDTRRGFFDIPLDRWHGLLQKAAGDSIRVTLYEKKQKGWHRYDTFFIYVAQEPVDSYLVYRRIAPGYRMWNEMGIYQRNLEGFSEETIISNKLTGNNCMNCHSFCNQSPESMILHQRSSHAGTYLITNNQITKLNPHANDSTSHPLVYPYWHPSGKYIAFSGNDTKQDFHLSSPNRVEVFDSKSDIVIYDLERGDLFSSSLLSSAENMETFPAFSPDGTRLYFCSSQAEQMPEAYKKVKYNLVSLVFNPATRTFGQETDTLYNARKEGRSAKFPRVSPDGKYLLYTLSDYGNFSAWHKDADLQLLNLNTQEIDSLSDVNSPDVESYHSWSSNSRWFVFSSRRIDGLYTRPFICYISRNGKTGKPFILPQKDADYYSQSLFSFNIPEFVKGKVEISAYDLTKFTLQH